MGLSNDLRERVVEAVVLGGLSRNQAAAHFKVSIASAVRWVKRFQTTGEISPVPCGGDRRSGRIEAHRDYLLSLIRRSPDMTLLEIQERLIANCGERFAVSVLWRFFDRHEITFKKTAHAEEQQRADVQSRRREWFAGQLDLDPTKLVFVDETEAKIVSCSLANKFQYPHTSNAVNISIAACTQRTDPRPPRDRLASRAGNIDSKCSSFQFDNRRERPRPLVHGAKPQGRIPLALAWSPLLRLDSS